MKAISRQTLINIASLTMGDADGVFELLKKNNINLDKDLEVLSEVTVPEWAEKKNLVTDYFEKRGKNMATGIDTGNDSRWILAFNYWRDSGIWVDIEKWND